MNINIIDRLNSVEVQRTALKERFGLEYNPFPRSGIAIISEADKIAERLMPVDECTLNVIVNFITDALYAHLDNPDSEDRYMSMVVRGEYGSGKTQTLMFIRYLLKNLKNEMVKPYVVYIDNPGQKLAELVGAIVSQIGVENFRKYLWGIFMEYLDKNQDVKQSLVSQPQARETSLFDDFEPTLSLSANIQNYKELVDIITAGKNAAEKKQLLQTLKDHMVKSYAEVAESPVVATYLYDVVSETIGISKSWDMLTSGSVKEMDKREVYILKAIVNIVRKQLGYTDFFILIDEFEDALAAVAFAEDISRVAAYRSGCNDNCDCLGTVITRIVDIVDCIFPRLLDNNLIDLRCALVLDIEVACVGCDFHKITRIVIPNLPCFFIKGSTLISGAIHNCGTSGSLVQRIICCCCRIADIGFTASIGSHITIYVAFYYNIWNLDYLGLCLTCGDHHPRIVVEQAVHHFGQIIIPAPVDEIEVHLRVQLLGLQKIRLRLLESPAEFDQFLHVEVRDCHAQGDRLHLKPGLEDLQDFADGDVRDIDAFFGQDF